MIIKDFFSIAREELLEAVPEIGLKVDDHLAQWFINKASVDEVIEFIYYAGCDNIVWLEDDRHGIETWEVDR